MFSALALATVMMTTSCGGGCGCFTPRANFAGSPPPVAGPDLRQLPLPARFGLLLATPAPFRALMAPLLLEKYPAAPVSRPSAAPKLSTVTRPRAVQPGKSPDAANLQATALSPNPR